MRYKLISVFKNRCPRCCKGKFWPYRPYYNLFFNSGKLYDRCSHCALKYYREIGFWYGAMYVSYALSVVLFLVLWAMTTIFLSSWKTWAEVVLICTLLLLLAPFNYYYSRLIWINIFVRYESDKAHQPSLNLQAEMKAET